jgi:nucleoside-diphosphate-sugar epimerase
MVITSSTNNTNIHRPGKTPEIIDETVFSDIKSPSVTPYAKSMILKEAAVWDFVKSRKDKGEYCPEVVALLPTTMLGDCIPGIHDSTVKGFANFATGEFLYGFSAPVELGCVDVDDVCLAHLKAIEVPEANGHRIIIAES